MREQMKNIFRNRNTTDTDLSLIRETVSEEENSLDFDTPPSWILRFFSVFRLPPLPPFTLSSDSRIIDRFIPRHHSKLISPVFEFYRGIFIFLLVYFFPTHNLCHLAGVGENISESILNYYTRRSYFWLIIALLFQSIAVLLGFVMWTLLFLIYSLVFIGLLILLFPASDPGAVSTTSTGIAIQGTQTSSVQAPGPISTLAVSTPTATTTSMNTGYPVGTGQAVSSNNSQSDFSNILPSIVLITFSLVFFPLSVYLTTIIPIRLTFHILNRAYAEVVCVRECLFLVIDLRHTNEFISLKKRKALQYRISYLSEITLKLGSKYSRNIGDNRSWVDSHFSAMSSYCRERERWIAAPTKTTLATLTHDFSYLAEIFITGNYGDFSWQASEINQNQPSRLRQVAKFFTRFIGLAVPLLLMGLYLINPDLFPFLIIDKVVLTYVFISWLLISIDVILGLGVVKELANVAKTLKA